MFLLKHAYVHVREGIPGDEIPPVSGLRLKFFPDSNRRVGHRGRDDQVLLNGFEC